MCQRNKTILENMARVRRISEDAIAAVEGQHPPVGPREQSMTPHGAVCEECMRNGTTWVHLRMCRICGHVGCCNSSQMKHATAHNHATGHDIVQSMEPTDGDWNYSYVKNDFIDIPPYPTRKEQYDHGDPRVTEAV